MTVALRIGRLRGLVAAAAFLTAYGITRLITH